MAVKIEQLELPGCLLVTVDRFGDDRGYFSETYNRDAFRDAGLKHEFIQDNQSLSAPRGTVRGMHFQSPPFAQAKLLRVLRGALLDVAVDIRAGSPTFGRHIAVELDAATPTQIFIPEGFAHGFCTLQDNTEVLYKVTAPYAPDNDHGLLWNDPDLGIDWPVDAGAAVLSDKDKRHPRLIDLPEYFAYQ